MDTSKLRWTSPFVILGMSGLFCHFYSGFFTGFQVRMGQRLCLEAFCRVQGSKLSEASSKLPPVKNVGSKNLLPGNLL